MEAGTPSPVAYRVNMNAADGEKDGVGEHRLIPDTSSSPATYLPRCLHKYNQSRLRVLVIGTPELLFTANLGIVWILLGNSLDAVLTLYG